MISFIYNLFNNIFSSLHAFRINLFSITKGLILTALIPFVYMSLFIPFFTSLEALIYSVSYVFGNGLLFLFINTFWSVHVNLCVSFILSLKLTLYFHHLYLQVRLFQFESLRAIK